MFSNFHGNAAAVKTLEQMVRTSRIPHTILLDGPEGDGIRAQSPFNRVAKPEELAKAVYFLAAADSEWASGAVLDFNGASYLRM